MQPVALQANKSLYSEEFQNISNRFQALVSSGVIDASTAQRLTNEAFTMYMNPYNTVSSGSTFQKIVGVNTIANGGIDSPASWVEQTLKGLNYSFGQAGNDSMGRAIIQSKWGTPISSREWNNANYNDAMSLLANINTLSNDELMARYNQEVSNADNYNTNTQKWDTAVINASSDIAEIKSIITDKGWEIGKVIVGGITAWLGTKLIGGVIGKGISALSGVSAGGISAVSKGGLIGSSLKMVAGVAGILAATAAIVKLGDSMNSKLLANQQSKANTDSTKFTKEMKEQLKDTELEGNKAAIATRSAGEGYNAGEGNWRTIYDRSNANIVDDWWADTKGNIGNFLDNVWFFNNPSRDDAQAYNDWKLGQYLNANHSMINNDDYMHLMLTYYAFMASQGLNGNYTGNGDVNDKNVKAYIKDVLADDALKEQYGDALNILSWEGIVNKYGTPISDKWEEIQNDIIEWSSHRYGLNKVPFDYYPALLHEGEAVLSASTANELRNLLAEYRANNQSVINLDIAIQNQTVELVGKLNEVISVIRSSNIGTMASTASIDQANAIQKLQYSMSHLISTKSALD